METKLEYGMVVEMDVNPIQYEFYGIGISSSMITEKMKFTVEKYHESDTNPLRYKVKLMPFDQSGRFGVEHMYGSDLTSLISKGHINVIAKPTINKND
jgi:hypothetical protein